MGVESRGVVVYKGSCPFIWQVSSSSKNYRHCRRNSLGWYFDKCSYSSLWHEWPPSGDILHPAGGSSLFPTRFYLPCIIMACTCSNHATCWLLHNCMLVCFTECWCHIAKCMQAKSMNSEIPLADVIMGTTAAPYYFPPHDFERDHKKYCLVDGGIAANNPVILLPWSWISDFTFH